MICVKRKRKVSGMYLRGGIGATIDQLAGLARAGQFTEGGCVVGVNGVAAEAAGGDGLGLVWYSIDVSMDGRKWPVRWASLRVCRRARAKAGQKHARNTLPICSGALPSIHQPYSTVTTSKRSLI